MINNKTNDKNVKINKHQNNIYLTHMGNVVVRDNYQVHYIINLNM